MKKLLFVFFALPVLFCACNSGSVLPNATGTAFEVLVVIDEADWKSSCGKEIFDMLNADMPALPQPEPLFKISHVPHSNFDNFLRPARNLILVNISPNQYTQSKIIFAKNRWAKKQAIVILNAPTREEISLLLAKEKNHITDYFLKTERERYIAYLQTIQNKKAQDKIFEKFGVQILIPSDINLSKEGENFFWLSNGSSKARQDIVIYSYPYTELKDFTLDCLIQKRDSVFKQNIPGPENGSFMGTERQNYPPLLKEISMNKSYCAQINGLWKVFNGSLMGGPFLSHSRLDEISGRIITIEGFVFAPGKDKRNYIRQMEAVVYSAKMPHEVNEIVVVEKKKKE